MNHEECKTLSTEAEKEHYHHLYTDRSRTNEKFSIHNENTPNMLIECLQTLFRSITMLKKTTNEEERAALRRLAESQLELKRIRVRSKIR